MSHTTCSLTMVADQAVMKKPSSSCILCISCLVSFVLGDSPDLHDRECGTKCEVKTDERHLLPIARSF